MLPEHLSKPHPSSLLAELIWLRNQIATQGHEFVCQHTTESHDDKARKSAANLGQYLALRRHDLRQIQDRLQEMGLTSLGGCESHVLATLDRVIALLNKKQSQSQTELPGDSPNYQEGKAILAENTETLFGTKAPHRTTRIMVTLPTEAAHDKDLVSSLLESGMNAARINCAHDSPETWQGMIENVRTQAKALDRDCKVMMDLAGQKIRTGAIAQQGGVIRIRVKRNVYGAVMRPTFVELFAPEYFPLGQAPFEESHRHSIPVPVSLYKHIETGQRLCIEDARGKSRHFQIHAQPKKGIWLASTEQGIYVTEGCSLKLQGKEDKKWLDVAHSAIPKIQTQDVIIRLHEGDTLRLTYEQIPAQAASCDPEGNVLEPAYISCTQPIALQQLEPGQPVWIDDGKLGGIVTEKDALGVLLKLTHAPTQGYRLKPDKGINFPHTNLDLPCLTEKDRFDIKFISKHADIIGLSFAQKAEDMQSLMNELNKWDARHLAVVAKIETKQGIKNLPEIILQGLGHYNLGVMIARGDLAVELGGERLAEMQEEILWLCESAHVPVIWATQVLETLSKNGIATRPELTDAAMSGRAECVMLNKGPHIVQATKILDSILSRMESHQYKKAARLRALHQWD